MYSIFGVVHQRCSWNYCFLTALGQVYPDSSFKLQSGPCYFLYHVSQNNATLEMIHKSPKKDPEERKKPVGPHSVVGQLRLLLPDLNSFSTSNNLAIIHCRKAWSLRTVSQFNSSVNDRLIPSLIANNLASSLNTSASVDGSIAAPAAPGDSSPPRRRWKRGRASASYCGMLARRAAESVRL